MVILMEDTSNKRIVGGHDWYDVEVSIPIIVLRSSTSYAWEFSNKYTVRRKCRCCEAEALVYKVRD